MKKPAQLVWLVLCLALAPACQKKKSPLERGRATFMRSCASCHGPVAKGGPLPGFVNAPRDLTNPEFQASISDAELTRVIAEGKGQMPGFALLGDDQIADIVGFIRSLAPTSGSERSRPRR